MYFSAHPKKKGRRNLCHGPAHATQLKGPHISEPRRCQGPPRVHATSGKGIRRAECEGKDGEDDLDTEIPWLGYGGYWYRSMTWLDMVVNRQFFPNFRRSFGGVGFPFPNGQDFMAYKMGGWAFNYWTKSWEKSSKSYPCCFCYKALISWGPAKNKSFTVNSMKVNSKAPTRIDDYCIFPTVNQAGIK